MQDKIILGLLLDGDKSSYDLKKSMESSTGFFYNSSQGSIQPALKKLVQHGHVRVTEERRGARIKMTYSITEEGEQAFLRWAGEPIALEKPRDPALVKMFFFNYVEGARKRELVAAYLREIEQVEAMLNMFRQRNQELLGNNEALRKDPKVKSRLDTLEFGSSYYAFLKEWYGKYLNRIEEELEP
ncbi:PadR family transcriptional regulator [Paenibacillus methanolicus]|uniref:DNA-binding PadR family transcriptional regulator n=1 Tax=Paenibacillus methanolicus TaxID=582686 RepID=A0A5S5C800_9BACL|nr:PadR family transcriptional regulator [Paenibacillus methanolicus]TYP74612.1 DNA-binding PadR family transcriptional regulator [Paenibacillus methanolicus]